jgi:ribosomal protein S18 acetylase RimI-like enzyme
MQIRSYEQRDLEAVIGLSLRAWQPVFESIETVMSRDVFRELHPDWRVTQRKAVEAVCTEPKARVWVAEANGAVVAFVAVTVHSPQLGEVHMLAVDPDHQRQGLGAALTNFATDWLASQGISVAMIETGGDSGHAPARRTYEKCGFEPLRVVRYFKRLSG